ncbi:hypothetical protein GGH95_005289, partial [Coemansia sp. RSA 1836]
MPLQPIPLRIQQHISAKTLYLAGKTAPDIHKTVKEAYGEDAVHINTICRWIRKFELGDLSIEDAPRSGHPSLEIADLYRDRILEDIAVDP